MAVSSTKRRTTLTLPAATLATAKKFARDRNVNLSVVVAEAMEKSFREQLARKAAEEYVERMSRSFTVLTEEELLTVNGIYLTERKKRKRK